MMIVSMIIPFVMFFLLNVVTIRLLKLKFGESFPLTMMLSVLIVYLPGIIFRTNLIGIISLFAISLFGIYLIVKYRHDKEFINNIFSVGFLTYIYVYIIVQVMFLNYRFYAWDEFTHWGRYVRSMFNENMLYIFSKLGISHKNYPPFLQIFEYIWLRFQFKFSEYGISEALHFFEFSIFVIPICEKFITFKNKILNKIAPILLLLSVLLFAVSFDIYNVYKSIYLDPVVAFFFGYIFYFLFDNFVFNFNNNKTNLFILAISLFSFAILKDISILLIVSLFLSYLLYTILNIIIAKEKIIKDRIYVLLCLSVIPVISYFFWQIFVNILKIKDQFNLSDITFQKFINIACKNLNNLQKETIDNFINQLFKTRLNYGLIGISFIFTIILIIALLLLIYFFNRKIIKSRILIAIVFYILVSSTIYVIFFSYIYCYTFSEFEMKNLASFTRYMNSYTLSIIFIFIYILLKFFNNKKNWLLIFIFLFTSFNRLCYVCTTNNNDRHICARHISSIVNLMEINKKNIFIISFDGNDVNRDVALNYYTEGKENKYTYIDNDVYINENYNKYDEIEHNICTNNYVYIDVIGGNLFKMLLKYCKSPRERAFYEVTSDNDGKVVLKQVAVLDK